jgi:hypothetical protein
MSNVGQRNYELAIMTAVGGYNDYEFFLSGSRGKAGEFNVSGYSSVKFDDLFHRGSTATDLATRRDLLQRAERRSLIGKHGFCRLKADKLEKPLVRSGNCADELAAATLHWMPPEASNLGSGQSE